MAEFNFGYQPPNKGQKSHWSPRHGTFQPVTPLNEIQPPQPYAGHHIQASYPQSQIHNPSFQSIPAGTLGSRYTSPQRGYRGPNTRTVERQDSSGQERGRIGGKGKPFWKDRHLATDEERIEYLRHCKKWTMDEDESLVISRIRQASEPLVSILSCHNIDTNVIQLLLEVLTCDHLLEPPHAEKQTAFNIFAKVLDSEFIKSVFNLSSYICDVYDSFEEQMVRDFARLKNIYLLLNHLATIHQSEIEVLWPLIRSLNQKMPDNLPVPIPEDLNYEISHLYTRCKEIRDKKTENKKIRAQNKQTEDDANTDYGCSYTQMEILPSKNEIVNPNNAKLRALLTKKKKVPTATLR